MERRSNTKLPIVKKVSHFSRQSRQTFSVHKHPEEYHSFYKTKPNNDQKYAYMKAQTFLANSRTISNPNTIFAVMDQVRNEVGRKFEENVFNKTSYIENTNSIHLDEPEKKTNQELNIFFKKLKGDKGKSYFNNQRSYLTKLKNWLNIKLQYFKKGEGINIADIVDYKQTVLNYGLGKIITSVSNKCNQQGQLLKCIWDNTFAIFQALLGTLAQMNFQNDKNNLNDNIITQKLYEKTIQNQQQVNKDLLCQNQALYDKMKSVIIWNRKLKKQRQKLYIQNRIQKYRNYTYSAALEETVSMLLMSCENSQCMSVARKILLKLAKEKKNNKGGKINRKRQTQQKILEQSKQFVKIWLKQNTQFYDQNIIEDLSRKEVTNEDIMDIKCRQDQDNLKNIDIYEYFKLLDVGVQVSTQQNHKSTQFQQKNKEDIGINTKKVYKYQRQIQTNQVLIIDSQQQQKKLNRSIKIGGKDKNLLKEGAIKNNQSILKKKKSDQKKQGLFDKQPLILKPQISENPKKFQGKQNKNLIKQYSLEDQDEQNTKFPSFKEINETMLCLPLITDTNLDCSKNLSNTSLMNDDHQFGSKQPTDCFQVGSGHKGLSDYQSYTSNQKKVKMKNTEERVNYNKQFQNLRKQLRQKSMNFFKQLEIEEQLPLCKKKFSQIYKELKESMLVNNDGFNRRVIRGRSFHQQKKVAFKNQVSVDEHNDYRNKMLQWGKKINGYNMIRQNTYNKILEERLERINKKNPIASNMIKARTFQNNFQTFKNVMETVSIDRSKIPHKNKQFFQSSVSAINRYIHSLYEDYLKQIRRQRDQVQIECEKIHYPLRILLVQAMDQKYGLRQISQKKLKHFIERIRVFSSGSEKVHLYSKLLGMENQNVSADELILYLRCLVYFDNKVSILVGKDHQFSRTLINQQTICEWIPKIVEGYFNQKYIPFLVENLKNQCLENGGTLSIERIASLLIDEILICKSQFKNKYLGLYELCTHGNFFSTLYQILTVLKNNSIKIQTDYILNQFIKHADMIHQLYGRSISEHRFILCCIVLNLPDLSSIHQLLRKIRHRFLKSVEQFSKAFIAYNQENYQTVLNICYKWGITVQYDQVHQPNRWNWLTLKILSDKIEATTIQTLGMLGQLNSQANECINNF